MNACTTNPPPNESNATSQESRNTIGRDAPNPDGAIDAVVLGGLGGASTATVSRPAITIPTSAAGTNNTKNREPPGAFDHDGRSPPPAPAANAPIDPAAVATAL